MLRQQFRRMLEQPHIVALDPAHVAQQDCGEFIAALAAEEAREDVERLGLRRQRVGLLVGHHLQAMLDAAQEIIGRGEFVARLAADPFLRRQCVERGDRIAAAQFGMAAAGNELLGLHEKLDLADAAAAELDIVPFDRDLAMAAIGVDLPLHFVDVGDGREVEIFAPDEGRQFAEELVACNNIAGAWPRLDQRRALPVLAAMLVIIERRRGRDRNLGRGRIGPQPQIDAEHITVGRALLQYFDQIARQPHVELAGLEIGRQAGPRRARRTP